MITGISTYSYDNDSGGGGDDDFNSSTTPTSILPSLPTNLSSSKSVTLKGQSDLESSLGYAYGLAAVCFVGGIENVLVLLTIWRSKRLRSPYYAFIGNLATAQLLFCLMVGITFGWMRIIFFSYGISPRTTMLACAAAMLPYHAAQVCALLCRFVIGVDRLFAFSLPMGYRNRNNCYGPSAIIACWLWPAVEALTYFGVNYQDFRYRRMPMCSGSGWKTGHFLTYTAYRDLAMGGLTALTYVTTAVMVTRKFVLLRLRRGETVDIVHSKPYQFRLLIASGADAAIFTVCNMAAYLVRSFVLMHLDGEQRMTANFSVGLLLASTNVTDFLLYLAINRDFRYEFVSMMKFSKNRRERSNTNVSSRSTAAVVRATSDSTSSSGYTRCTRISSWFACLKKCKMSNV